MTKLYLTTGLLLTTTLGWAQPGTLKGSFVLSEEGQLSSNQPMAGLAALNFSDNGSVTGMKIMQSPGTLTRASVQGAYTLNADGTGTLSLLVTAIPSDSESQPWSENFRLMADAREITAIRTDSGVLTLAQLTPAGGAGEVKGSYLMVEKGKTQPYTGLGTYNFDGAGGVWGHQMVGTVGALSVFDWRGNYWWGADGFGMLTVSASLPGGTNEDPAGTASASYIFLATANELKALRVDVPLNSVSNFRHQ